MSRGLISIVIPTYNHAHLISKCLQSVIDQSYSDWEAIVVNNFSVDNTEEVVGSFRDDRIKLVNFDNGGVIAAARNEGVRQSKGGWIAFLDSDDWWYPEKLQKVSEHFSDSDIVYHKLDVYFEGVRKGRSIGASIFSPAFESLLCCGNPIPNSSAVIKKALVDSVGLLSEDPKLFAIEDYELWLKSSLKSDRFSFIDSSLGGYYVGSNNNSAYSERTIARNQYVYSLYLPKLPKNIVKFARARLKYLTYVVQKECGVDAGFLQGVFLVLRLDPRCQTRLRSLFSLLVSYCRLR